MSSERASTPDRNPATPTSAQTENAAPEIISSNTLHDLQHLQRLVGNQALQRLIADKRAAEAPARGSFIQRFWPFDSEPASGTPAPDAGTEPAAPEEDPTFLRILNTAEFSQSGDRFDSKYQPNNGNPATTRPVAGTLEITLKLHIIFRDFDRAIRREAPYNTMRFTPEQRATFNWTQEQREKFSRDMISSIQGAWSGQHRMTATTPGCEELNAGVDVKVQLVDDPGSAHNTVTALKIPEGAPRYRSFVQGNTSMLDYRDPSEPEEKTMATPSIRMRIGPFATNDATLTGAITSQIDTFVTQIDAIPAASDEEFASKFTIGVNGHASLGGSRRHNEQLSEQRANAVGDYIMNRSRRSQLQMRIRGLGVTGATNEDRFQSVGLTLIGQPETFSQNVAAHEAGHMLGLDDEYPDADANRMTGERSGDFSTIEAELGIEAANETLVGNTQSMMSQGGRVQRGHYVYFLQALEQMTSIQWTI